VVVVVVVMGLMVKDTRILVVGPPKSWLRVLQKVMPRNPDKLAHAKCLSGLERHPPLSLCGEKATEISEILALLYH